MAMAYIPPACTGGDYNNLKNKPFYSKIEVKTLLKETYEVNVNNWSNIDYVDFKENGTYTIILNGETYEVPIYPNPHSEGFMCGNLAIADVGEDTGEPFFIYTEIHDEEKQCAIFYSIPYDGDEPVQIELEIIGETETIKKIDEKYLPTSNNSSGVFTLKLNEDELQFIETLEVGIQEYDSGLQYINKKHLQSVIFDNVNTVIFEGYEHCPYKVVGAYQGFNYNERVILERAIYSSSDDGYTNHRIIIKYSDDMGRCYMQSYYGNFAGVTNQYMYFDSNGNLAVVIDGVTRKFASLDQ
jgi:hypothetical protein